MKLNIIHIIDKIVDFNNSLIFNIKSFKKNIGESLEKNSIGRSIKFLYNSTFRRILKHKEMIIPILLLLFLSPAISLLLGLEFCNNPVNKVTTIIVNHDDSESVQSLIQMIEDNDVFDVVMHSDNDDDIKKNIDNGTAMAGIVIPENFSEDILNGKEAKILSFVDGAFTSPASSAKGAVSEILGTIKAGYLMKLAEGKLGMQPQNAQNLISPFGYTYRFIGNPAKNMSLFMVEGLVLNCLQIAIAITATCIGEKKSYIKLIGKGLIVALLGVVSAYMCMYIQIKYFNIPYRGSVLGGILLTTFCCIGWAFFGIMTNYSKNGDKLLAASSCGIVSMTMLFSGYTFPVLAMPEIFSKIAPFMPNTHFIIPLRDISLLGYTYSDISSHVAWLAKFALLMFGLATLKFIQSKLPKKEKKKNKKVKGRNHSDSNNMEDISEINLTGRNDEKSEDKEVMLQ
ncbi:MAG: ABC transporter permease [Clostridium sp.]